MSAALQQHMRTAENYVHATVGTPYENATWKTLQTEFEAFFDDASADITVDLLLSEKALTTLPETFPQRIDEQPADVAIRSISDVVLSFDVIDQVCSTIDIPHPAVSDDRLGVVGIKDSQIIAEFERRFQRLWTDADPVLE